MKKYTLFIGLLALCSFCYGQTDKELKTKESETRRSEQKALGDEGFVVERGNNVTSEGYTLIGSPGGLHTAIDHDDIQAKSSTGANYATLWLNYWGGNVSLAFGGDGNNASTFIGTRSTNQGAMNAYNTLYVDGGFDRVGIGINAPSEKLDVDRAIKLSDNADDTPEAGTIRWNAAIEDFEGFNGTQWLSLTSKKDDKFWGRTDLSYNSTECNKATASDAAGGDAFGDNVSVSGDYVIIAASRDDDTAINSGSAYIFKRSGTTWMEEAKLTASDAAGSDWFGESVSIDGDYAIIGAPLNDDDGSDSDSAYIFKRSGTTWTEEVKLTASDAAGSDNFGEMVSIDGDYAIIAAPFDDDDGSGSGSAYIFKRSGTTWMEEAKLTASDAAEGGLFGYSVSIDGDYVIVGARQDDDNGNSSGSAYIFKRNGTSWIEEQKLTVSDAAELDFFGESVTVNSDFAIIGAIGDDDNGISSGSVYFFD
jgi:hypothetical protein